MICAEQHLSLILTVLCFTLHMHLDNKMHAYTVVSFLQIVLPLGDAPSKRSGKNPKQDSQDYPIEGKKITSQTGEVGIVRRSPDMDSLTNELKVSQAGAVLTQQLSMGSSHSQPPTPSLLFCHTMIDSSMC